MLICLKNFRTAHVKSPESNSNMDWISARWRSDLCSLALGFLFPLPFFLMFWSISLARQKSQAGTPIPQR